MKGLGGLARHATLLRRLAADPSCGPLLRVDGGDLTFGHPMVAGTGASSYFRDRARLTVALTRDMGVDALALGDADLVLGLPAAMEHFAPLGEALICSTLDGDVAALPARHRVIERGGFRIGILAALGPLRDPGLLGGATIVPAKGRIREEAAALRAANCDLVILLSHLGADADRDLLPSLDDVDLVVCGCCPGPLSSPRPSGRTLYLSALGGGGQVGVLDIMGREGRSLQTRHRLVTLDDDVALDQGVQDRIRSLETAHRAGTTASSTPPSGAALPPAARPVFGADYCASCHQSQWDAWRGSGHARAQAALPAGSRNDPECLGCHTTAPEGPMTLPGVQCEACHDVPPSHPAGKHGRVNTGIGSCLRCHTPVRSPSFDPRGSWRRAACPPDGPVRTLAALGGGEPSSREGRP